MGEEQQEKTLQDMEWPTNQIFQPKQTYTDDVDDYGTIIIKNPGFWEGKGRETDNVPMAFTDENGDTKIKFETRSVLSGEHWANYAWLVNSKITEPEINKKACVISPFLYLRYVLRESLRMNGWYIHRNDMIPNTYYATMFYGLMIYNNVSIVEPVFVTESTNVPQWNYENNELEDKNNDIITEQEW
jgi:hypothetical protein